MNVQDFEDWHV